jgi:uncharacterized protein YdaL
MIRPLRRAATAVVVAIFATLLAVAPGPVPTKQAEAAVANTLLLYDNTGAYAFLGEQYAMMTGNLLSQFGTYTARPVGTYTAGMMSQYTAVIYLGSTYDEPIPVAFLDDVLAGTKPVMWMFSNIWQLTNRQFAKTGQYWANVRGWDWAGYDTSPIGEVIYKGRSLTRYSPDQSGIMNVVINDPAKATALALAKRADGTTFPWATKSGNLTYVGEMPLSYISEDNRYLAFADLLFGVLDPTRPERHRALVRLEDVSAESDPADLRAVADTLAAEGVPFSVTVIPEYRDPKGVYNGGQSDIRRLNQAPEVVSALRYMQSKGGTLIMHGWTHQIDGLNNPYNEASGDDTEFFRLIEDPVTNNVIFVGPLPKDSQNDHQKRINTGKGRFTQVGLAAPTIFTPPHYAASPNAYKAIKASFGARYDRGLYFSRQLAGGTVDTSRFVGQFFPYPVTDINGSRVVPENIGNEELDAFNNNPPRLPADIIANAQANLVVRDGFASFFWHPYLVSDPRAGTAHLRQIVQGIKALGYQFVSSTSIAGAGTPYAFRSPATADVAATTGAPAATGKIASSADASAKAPKTKVPRPAQEELVRKPPAPLPLGEQLKRDPDPGPIAAVEHKHAHP